jgi:hypothetical protein
VFCDVLRGPSLANLFGSILLALAAQGGSELGADLLAMASPKMAQLTGPMAPSQAVGITSDG